MRARGGPAGLDARRPRARVLGQEDLGEARALCALDPVTAVLAAARLDVAAVAGFAAAGGQAWGFPAVGPLVAVCWSGANLVPVLAPGLAGTDADDAVAAFAAMARAQGRRSSSIVGDRTVALALWDLLAPRWPPAREVRADQPSLAIARDPDVEPDPLVRRSRLDEVDLVLPACVRMFAEEVGYAPAASPGSAYALRVRSLVAEGRSFVRTESVDPRPRPGPRRDGAPLVTFKAELGAVSGGVAQVQGVWVDPLRRGRGLAAPGMAAVVVQTRREVAPVVSLYVNAFNAPALATYRRVGFEQVGTFTTVLF
ncbi:GNAT family N-acetyltransferase [Isoptericola sp. 4D.3]|uniref:GNAT family N-acetyltransferase n=2 Tax=Isoptericola peretonis TaxID=2918523 RepID=A0ABT0J810_9MICO|nr:GNAT family N-acetyltransferase [Isoptericola sp. 4D.3]